MIRLANGDQITGEIKQLEQGKLQLSTSALETVYVEWDKIDQLASTYVFEFEDRTGARHFGRITSESSATVTIVDELGRSTTLLLADIVHITPIEESFWSQLDGRISLGFSYTKGSDVGQLFTNAGLEYRTRKLWTALDLSSTITRDSEEETTSRDSLSLNHNRYSKRWFGWSQASLEKNEALGLDLRSLISAGAGRSLIQSSQSLLETSVGLAFSEETSSDSSSSSGEVEGVLRASYSVFRFTEREVNSDFELSVFPSLTQSGRVRSELDANIKREIAKNLYLELSGYFSHDNESPSGSAESDFGVVTSLGWSF